jgi:hypothetical protein
MGDISRLADDQRARYARTCSIVFNHEICGCVLRVSPVSRHRCHNHSVLEVDRADLDRLKELGSGHCKAYLCVKGLLMQFSSHTMSFIERFAEVDDHSSLSGMMGLQREVGE